jgi:signal transduction histidine kinase
VNPATGQLVPRIGMGALAESLQHRVQRSEGAAGVVWETGRPVVIDRYDTWPGRIQAFRPQAVGAMVAVPLLAQTQVVGVLGLAHAATDTRVFEPEAVDVLTQFARLAVIAIDNSRLFAQVQRELVERRQAEGALRESQAILAAAERAAHIGSWRWDMATHKAAWSDEMFRLFAISPADFDGDMDRIIQLRVHPDDAAAVQKITHQVIQRQPPPALESRLSLPGGLERTTLTEGWLVLDETGQPAAVAGYVQDITERKRVETELRQLNTELEQRVAARTAELSARSAELSQTNADLARVMRGKDEFLASMSHELRTPLTGILGMTEALEMSIYGNLSEQQLQAIRVVKESGQHLLSLINDVLDLAKVESGKLPLDLAPVSAKEVCQASLRLVYGQAGQKKITTHLQVDAGVTRLWADERRLKQMLVNLLSNAIKFTSASGQVGLEVAGDPAHEEVRFTVWDTGIGLRAEEMALLFQPFVQVDNALTRTSGGSGLGLALVRGMAELHGGRVAVESEGVPGRGSRFTVVLPWKLASQAPPADLAWGQPVPVLAKPAAAGQLVLVADDVETIREVLTSFLSTLGCQVAQARDGVEAWAMLRELKPALALVDIQMPGLDGLEIMRRVRADPLLANVPIIAMTALAMPGDRERCLAAGANDYLSKPINRAQLIARVKQWLNL